MIFESIKNWNENPISTSIETLPISQLTLPNLTVCPPKKSSLNLNYDIFHSDEKQLDKDTRKELIEYAMKVIQDEFSDEIMTNLSKIEDPERFYNWYHGYSQIMFPYYDYTDNLLNYFVWTTDTSANISTQYFGDKYDADKVDGNIAIRITFSVPTEVRRDSKSILSLDVKRNIMKEFVDSDQIYIRSLGVMDADLAEFRPNFTVPFESYYYFRHIRKVSDIDIKNMKLDNMPGFRFMWAYNTQTKQSRAYSNRNFNKQYRRSAFPSYLSLLN